MKAIRALLLSAIVSACADSMTAPGPSTPPGPVTATVSYCAGLEPLWVAFQDGDGAWTRALPTVSDGMTAFQFTFASNRGAIATTTAGGQGITDLHVLYGSPAELEAEGDVSPRFCTSAATKTLLGTVAGLDTNEIAFPNRYMHSHVEVVHLDDLDRAAQVLAKFCTCLTPDTDWTP